MKYFVLEEGSPKQKGDCRVYNDNIFSLVQIHLEREKVIQTNLRGEIKIICGETLGTVRKFDGNTDIRKADK